MDSVLVDVAGHRRSPATLPGYHRGRPPRNKGEHYPAISDCAHDGDDLLDGRRVGRVGWA
jgi:hypothetical protein